MTLAWKRTTICKFNQVNRAQALKVPLCVLMCFCPWLYTIWSIRGQFHQRSTRSFYIHKLCAHLFCAYFFVLCFTGLSLPAKKLCVERWWNWPQVYRYSNIEAPKVRRCAWRSKKRSKILPLVTKLKPVIYQKSLPRSKLFALNLNFWERKYYATKSKLYLA